MSIRVFDIVMCIWSVVFLAVSVFCSVNAIISVIKSKKRFMTSYVLEIMLISINLIFMYAVDNDYILYGDNKFSGLNRMGDWLGFLILTIVAVIPIIITLVCQVIYIVKSRKNHH